MPSIPANAVRVGSLIEIMVKAVWFNSEHVNDGITQSDCSERRALSYQPCVEKDTES